MAETEEREVPSDIRQAQSKLLGLRKKHEKLVGDIEKLKGQLRKLADDAEKVHNELAEKEAKARIVAQEIAELENLVATMKAQKQAEGPRVKLKSGNCVKELESLAEKGVAAIYEMERLAEDLKQVRRRIRDAVCYPSRREKWEHREEMPIEMPSEESGKTLIGYPAPPGEASGGKQDPYSAAVSPFTRVYSGAD